jgi:hypothetical protein
VVYQIEAFAYLGTVRSSNGSSRFTGQVIVSSVTGSLDPEMVIWLGYWVHLVKQNYTLVEQSTGSNGFVQNC